MNDNNSSLPARERGLKQNASGVKFRFSLSLPARERGLKPTTSGSSIKSVPVAPRAGAWIETRAMALFTQVGMSLPARERGLKQHLQYL